MDAVFIMDHHRKKPLGAIAPYPAVPKLATIEYGLAWALVWEAIG